MIVKKTELTWVAVGRIACYYHRHHSGFHYVTAMNQKYVYVCENAFLTDVHK